VTYVRCWVSVRPIHVSGVSLLVILLGIHGVMKGRKEPFDVSGEPGIETENRNGAVFPEWLGLNLLRLLGPITTLDGDRAEAPEPGLTLWIIIRDSECLVCLYELPLIAAYVDSLQSAGISMRAVAVGDRLEARRTLWGIEAGMPVYVCGSERIFEAIATYHTPLRILTWHGRIVGLSRLPINSGKGYRALDGMVRRWIAECY